MGNCSVNLPAVARPCWGCHYSPWTGLLANAFPSRALVILVLRACTTPHGFTDRPLECVQLSAARQAAEAGRRAEALEAELEAAQKQLTGFRTELAEADRQVNAEVPCCSVVVS